MGTSQDRANQEGLIIWILSEHLDDSRRLVRDGRKIGEVQKDIINALY
jgi:hypothetical protein